MHPDAVKKARSRLDLAKNKLKEAESCTRYDEFTGIWYFFLISVKNVYTCLEQGAKNSARSRQWFGSKKADRKADPLLQYIFQARDDDEHGISNVTALKPASFSIGKSGPGCSSHMTISLQTGEKGEIIHLDMKSHDGLPIAFEAVWPHAVLVPVTGRGNIIYYPPTEHLGRTLPDNLPLTVGRLALLYLEGLVREAESHI